MRLHANEYIEALLYVLIPLLVHVVLTPRLLVRTLRQTKALAVGDADKGFVVREIAALTIFASWATYVPPSQEPNHLLQRAIAVHVAAKMKLEATRTDTMYQLTDTPLDRVTSKRDDDDEPPKVDEKARGGRRYSEYVKPPYSYEQLLQLQVSTKPTPRTWVEVESGVFFQYAVEGFGESLDEEPQHDASVRRVTMTFRFRSKRADASQAIDQLVAEAFLQYQKHQLLAIARDTTRYMFVQTIQEQAAPPAEPSSAPDNKKSPTSSTESTSTTKRIVFKRYPLGDDKAFKNLFFQDKPRVLHLLDNFTQRKGKFAVKGFPYKLGLLLHGPPGTGKTSLIKAVAQYTKRHIVSVSLSKIKTNQELMDALFDLRFPIEGRETPIQLDFQDVVFVMEDIDCAGASVVHARKDDSEEEDKRNAAKSGSRKWLSAAEKDSDKLNLSGLLNVLDGVVDCPGRIVIMTTNHPEKLDPALIRPGRVNAQLLLGPMASPQVVEMLEYYFGVELTEGQREDVASKTQDASLTPATVEEICAEHDSVERAIRALAQ